MPKQRGQAAKRGGAQRGRIVRDKFRNYLSITRTSAGNTITPTSLFLGNLGERAVSIGESFEFFRLTSLKVRGYITNGNVGTATASTGGAAELMIAFNNSPTAAQTAPTTVAQLTQMQHFASCGVYGQCGFSVGANELSQVPFKWFQTYGTGSVDSTELSAGNLVYRLSCDVTSSPVTIYGVVVIEGTIEYMSEIDPTLSLTVRIPPVLRDDPAVDKALTKLRSALSTAVIPDE